MGSGSLAGRVALVTGASSGLGRAVALRLAEQGAAVAVNYCRSKAAAREVADAIRARGGSAISIQADVSQPDAVAGMTRAVRDKLGPIELLVTSAGVTEYVPAEDLAALTKPMWDRILGVNVVGTFLCVQAALSQMQPAGWGSIVLVSSNSAYTAEGSSIPYVVSKAAVVSLTEALAGTLPSTIRVNAVAPGWMNTPWLDRYLPAEVKADVVRAARFAAVDDVADAVLHLLANESVNGATLLVDPDRSQLRQGSPSKTAST
jgi:3-oxoacyl-[acyl-carrier protein] reductase